MRFDPFAVLGFTDASPIGILFSPEAWSSFFQAMPWVFPLAAMVAGACWASFAGVLVDRLPRQVGIARSADGLLAVEPDPTVSLLTPSRCVCGDTLKPWQLIPVIGWLLARGQHHCGAHVPARYPAMEAATGLAAVITALHFGPSPAGFATLAALLLGVALGWMDWETEWVPERLSVLLLLLGLAASPFAPDPGSRIAGLIACLLVLWLSFLYLGWRHRIDAVSTGDLMLAAAGGAWLGMPMVPAYLGVTAVVFGLYTLPMRLRERPAAAEDIVDEGVAHGGALLGAPMGPALCAGIVICMFCPFLAMPGC